MESVNSDILDDLFDPNEFGDLPALPEDDYHPPAVVQPQKVNRWDPRLILDLAVGIDSIDEILDRYSLSEAEFNRLSETQSFRRELAGTIRDVRENGVAFSSKAKVQAEVYLGVLDDMINDPETPASVRLEAIRSTVKWGKLEPREEKGDGQNNATQVNVNINF